MSGLLRRITRSRTADAGEAPPEGRAAAPDGAPHAADLPAGDAARPAGDAAAGDPVRATTVLATPAGLDPAEGPVRPPAGRRGSLRRRLRYLRSARELMLRDLGGLLYEIHRTGGGNVDAHAPLVDAKVQRLVDVDAESRALEAALGAPRSAALVFQPGIGGSCPACGELYALGARFCATCSRPTNAVPVASGDHPVRAMPAAPEAPAAPAMPAAPEASAVPGASDDPEVPAGAAASDEHAQTGVLPAAGETASYPGRRNGSDPEPAAPDDTLASRRSES